MLLRRSLGCFGREERVLVLTEATPVVVMGDLGCRHGDGVAALRWIVGRKPGLRV